MGSAVDARLRGRCAVSSKWPAYGTRRKWQVRKLDGVWQAFDADGNLRYAADDWRVVMAFARLGLGPMKPPPSIGLKGLFG